MFEICVICKIIQNSQIYSPSQNQRELDSGVLVATVCSAHHVDEFKSYSILLCSKMFKSPTKEHISMYLFYYSAVRHSCTGSTIHSVF